MLLKDDTGALKPGYNSVELKDVELSNVAPQVRDSCEMW